MPDAAPPPFHPDGVVTLASGESHPNGIIADADAVYWVNSSANSADPAGTRSSIRRLDLQTRAVTTLVADAAHAFRVFASDDELFYGDSDGNGRILAASKQDGSTRVVIDGVGSGVDRLALDAERVYFSHPDANVAGQLVVRSVRHDGNEPLELGRISSTVALDLVADDANVYVTGNDDIYAIAKAGGTPVLIRSMPGSFTNLAQDGAYLYQTNRFDGTVERVLKTGAPGSVQVLASQQRVPARLIVADGTLYWTCRGDTYPGDTTMGTVMRLDLDGGQPEVVASELNHAAEVTVLPEAIVWTTVGTIGTADENGSIMAAPR